MVKEAFSESVENPQNIEMMWSDFFIQQIYVYKGTHNNLNGSPQNADMDDFRYGKKDANTFANNGEIDFRNVRLTENWDKRKDQIVFMKDEPLKGKFYFHINLGDNTFSDDHYLIKKVGDAYYVGFDYESNPSNGDRNNTVPRDHIFNDAIFKIVPAKYKKTYRIMAEDLAVDAGSDFDFNDVVFDAVIRKEYYPAFEGAVITLRAAGGTMPLYVGVKDDAHEVHKLFGVDTKTMVNTQARGEKEVVIFRLPDVTSLRDIAIYVGESTQPLEAKAGTAPAKLCCPATYDWTDECQKIEEKYENFEKAVKDGTELWYETKQIGW